jgi:transcriptional regulator with XRE-family HTH domain
MDQIRIGRFIAAERKRKGCTQKQLAEKLNISDKTVSKWECGKGSRKCLCYYLYVRNWTLR